MTQLDREQAMAQVRGTSAHERARTRIFEAHQRRISESEISALIRADGRYAQPLPIETAMGLDLEPWQRHELVELVDRGDMS